LFKVLLERSLTELNQLMPVIDSVFKATAKIGAA
jgi:hypothetical protein